MKDRATVRSTWQRTFEALRKRPTLEETTNVITVRCRYDKPIEIEGMDSSLVGTQLCTGSGNADVRPGFLGLGGLGLCLAQGYMKRFAVADIKVNGVEISLRATIDKRRALGLSDDIPAGYSTVQYHVEVDSDADEHQIQKIISEADSRSPWLYNFTQPLSVNRSVEIRREATAAE